MRKKSFGGEEVIKKMYNVKFKLKLLWQRRITVKNRFYSHTCAGITARVLDPLNDKVIAPPDYDPWKIVDLFDKYVDTHISNSGGREVDQEEWFEQKYKFVFFIVFSK